MNLNSLIKQCVTEVIAETSKIQDPTKEEMMQFLQTQSGSDEGWQDEAEVAIYWFANDYHGGQWSNLYSVLSTSPFRPVRSSGGIESEGDGMAKMFYDALVSKYAPSEYADAGFEFNPDKSTDPADVDNSSEYSHAPEMRVRSDEPQNDVHEGFDPQSMGVNAPMQAGESNSEFYSGMNNKMRKMEEGDEQKPRKGLLSPKGLATVEKWATTLDSRDAAVKMVDSCLRRTLGLTSADLADTTTFSNGLDMIEDLLKVKDWQGAYDVAKDTAKEMIEDEGGAGMDENQHSTKDLERFARQEKIHMLEKQWEFLR